MERIETDNVIKTASKVLLADTCIKNSKIIDVFSKEIFEADVLISGKYFAGFAEVGKGKAKKIIEAEGKYLIPGFIDSHVHIESSHCSPAVFSNLVVPNGTTTIVADPHEICNCFGLDALDYMLEASKDLPLHAFFVIPSCVPATPFEHSGATLLASDIAKRIKNDRILGLGEMMNYPGVINCDKAVIDKIQLAKDNNKFIDGHSPNIFDSDLDAYAAAGILNDHECATVDEMKDRIRRGLYVMIRQGTVCQDELNLLKGVNNQNYNRCLFCTDDRQAESLIDEGSINNNVRLAVEAGLDPIIAICIASINSAICYNLRDRGAIAPGYRADFSLVSSLTDFKMEKVFTDGKLVAENGSMIKPSIPIELPSSISAKMNVKDFTIDKLNLPLTSSSVRTIDIIPGGVVTKAGVNDVEIENGSFKFDKTKDISKIAVIERHKGTGNVAVALLKGYGIKKGAIATSVAHDSHNIIVCGTNDKDMKVAVDELIKINGGMVLAKDNEIIGSFAHPIAGLMSNESGAIVKKELNLLVEKAYRELEVDRDLDPFMTLCFMSLPVIPEYKITDMGLFDVTKFEFVDVQI